jgi:hypothetical protein
MRKKEKENLKSLLRRCFHTKILIKIMSLNAFSAHYCRHRCCRGCLPYDKFINYAKGFSNFHAKIKAQFSRFFSFFTLFSHSDNIWRNNLCAHDTSHIHIILTKNKT